MTTTPSSDTAPAGARTDRQRLVGVDATRGIALLGMIAVHALPAYTGEGEITWTYAVAAGRSAATFAVLAGVGIAFMTGRRRVPPEQRRGVAASLAARAGLVALIGFALGFADDDITSVILVYYGLMFLLAIPLTYLRTRTLALTGVGIAVLLPVLSHVVRAWLPESTEANPSLGFLLHNPGGLLTELGLTGIYPALPWMAYICAGIAIGRLRLSDPRVARGLLGFGAAAAVLASTVSWLLLVPLGGTDRLYEAGGLPEVIIYDILTWGGSGTTPITTWWWLATAAPHTTTSFDLVHTAGVAVALLGAMLLLAHLAVSRQLPALRTGLGVLGAAGGMTLTLYSAHIVVMNSALNEIDPTVLYLGQVAAALVFATAWRARTGRGPLEGVVSDVARAAKQRATAGARAPSGPRGRVAAGSAAAHGTPHVKEAAGAPEVGASEG